MEKCKVEFETQVGWSNWKKLEEVQLLEIIVIIGSEIQMIWIIFFTFQGFWGIVADQPLPPLHLVFWGKVWDG